eukprot:scaffold195097_cov31-Tisochrysis_lutea.AAC.2
MTTLVLLAKRPGPKSKTRLAVSLVPLLGPKAAQDFTTDFALSSLSDLLQRFSMDCDRRVLLYAPPTDVSREHLSSLLDALGVAKAWTLLPVLETPEGSSSSDLGAILMDAAKRCPSASAPNLIFIGMDSPTLPSKELTKAAQVCSTSSHAYICPAVDGGYVLLGLPADAKAEVAFADVSWSASDTCESQVDALARAGCKCEIGPTYADVDEAEDLRTIGQQLLRESVESHNIAPRVSALLNSLPESFLRHI